MNKLDSKSQIYESYHNYLANNYKENYIPRLIIQDGFSEVEVEEVISEIRSARNLELIKKRKIRNVINVILYILGTLMICVGLAFVILGNIRIGLPIVFFAVLIWIKANK